LLRQLNIGHKAVFSIPACKAQNTAILAVLRGFATQQDGVLDGATVQGLAVGAIRGDICAEGKANWKNPGFENHRLPPVGKP
jgi:hypothetical protein